MRSPPSNLGVAPEGVRPAVAEDQRQDWPRWSGGPDVHEVDPEAIEADAEVGEPGERRLLRRPVEVVRPVGDELAQVGEVGPERPPGVLGRVRPTSRAQPRAEVLERRGGGLRGERLGARRGVRHGTHRTGRAALPRERVEQAPKPAAGIPEARRLGGRRRHSVRNVCDARTPLVVMSVHAFIWPFSRAAPVTVLRVRLIRALNASEPHRGRDWLERSRSV